MNFQLIAFCQQKQTFDRCFDQQTDGVQSRQKVIINKHLIKVEIN